MPLLHEDLQVELSLLKTNLLIFQIEDYVLQDHEVLINVKASALSDECSSEVELQITLNFQ
jgi:hypothetical protein